MSSKSAYPWYLNKKKEEEEDGMRTEDGIVFKGLSVRYIVVIDPQYTRHSMICNNVLSENDRPFNAKTSIFTVF